MHYGPSHRMTNRLSPARLDRDRRRCWPASSHSRSRSSSARRDRSPRRRVRSEGRRRVHGGRAGGSLQPSCAAAGTRDEGARRGLRARERRDHRQHDLRPAGRRTRRAGSHVESGGAEDARHAGPDQDGPFREVLAGADAARRRCRRVSGVPGSRSSAARLRDARGAGDGASHLGVTVSPIRDGEGGDSHGAICLFTDLTAVDGARRAASAEGQPGAARRADGRHRPRVPQRAGDDPRLRPACSTSSAAARVQRRTSKAFAARPRRSDRSSRTS